jgi:hypothetical protein
MIIKSAACLAFTAACLTAIATLPAARAQTAGAYGTAPSAYGTPPATYGTVPGTPGTAQGANWDTQGNYAPQSQGSYAPPPPPDTSGTQTVTNGPQTDTGDVSPSWSARRNVIESERYDRLLETSPGFRQARMRRECGPITDPQLHQQCLDSFAQYEPSGATGYGSSTATRHYNSNYGR